MAFEKCIPTDSPGVKLYNIILMGVAMMLVFTATVTTSYSARNVAKSWHEQTNGTYNGDVYLASSMKFFTIAATQWTAPVIMKTLGLKLTMILGAITSCLYVAHWIYPLEWALYVLAILSGFGGGLNATCQGVVITACSDEKTVTRNTAIYHILIYLSFVIGNVLEASLLKGQETFSEETRVLLFTILTITAAVGTSLLLFLRVLPTMPKIHKVTMAEVGKLCHDARDTMIGVWNLLKTKDMLVLSLYFLYYGIFGSFRDGILPACTGFNFNFPDPKASIGILGFTNGIAALGGFLLLLVIGDKITQRGRDLLMTICLLLQTIGFIIIYLSYPDDCPIEETTGFAVLNDPIFVFIASALLTIGESFFVVAQYALFQRLYKDPKVLPAVYALSLSLQTLGQAGVYIYATIAFLYQVIIVVSLSFIGYCCFIYVEFETTKKLHKFS